MASPPPPVTASSSTPPSDSDSSSSSPPPPSEKSSSPPPSSDSSPPPPSEDSSPPPPKNSSPPPDQSSPPPPPSKDDDSPSSPPPPSSSSASPPPKDSSDDSPPPPSESNSSPPPSSSSRPPNSPSNSDNNPPSSSTYYPPPSSSEKQPPSSKLAPPPPPFRKTPSSSRGGSSSFSDDSKSSDSSQNTAIIAGIAVAGVLLLAIIIACVICSRSNKKKRKTYYMDPNRGPPPGGDYYHGSSNPWQHSPQQSDHVVKLPPPPGMMGGPPAGGGGGGGGGGGWGPPPVAPPTGMPSNEFSAGFSGPNYSAHIPPSPSPNVGGGMGLGFSKSQFSYEELATATSGFSQANLLGQGGFGYVHKGVLPNGQVVAVKSLKTGSGQGEREFQAEVEIISRVHHRHLVSLVGYCIADSQRMLVYEFVSNSTLEFHLHGKGRPVMDWQSRTRIAMGSAKGLAYLHEDCHPRIIHRDIKAANILLDDNYEAMVADFGLARLSSDNNTHVSTRVMGTFGYLAPEYASSGKLSDKSDVFSFGVMLLELITGKRPVDLTNYMEDSLVDWARPLLTKAIEDGDYSELVDPRLEGNYDRSEMARLVTCAAASIRHSARRRPKMSQIVRALEGDASLDDMKDGGAGVKPGQSSALSSNQGAGADPNSYDTCMYNADMMKFRKMVMNSQEFNSSEYGATSEYGLNPSSSSSETGNSGPHRQKL